MLETLLGHDVSLIFYLFIIFSLPYLHCNELTEQLLRPNGSTEIRVLYNSLYSVWSHQG